MKHRFFKAISFFLLSFSLTNCHFSFSTASVDSTSATPSSNVTSSDSSETSSPEGQSSSSDNQSSSSGDDSSSTSSSSSSSSSANSSSSSSSTQTSYTVTFRNYNDVFLGEDIVLPGETAVYEGEDPTREEDESHSYVWKGWDHSLEDVHENFVAKAIYESTLRQYEIAFVGSGTGGGGFQNLSCGYGSLPEFSGLTPYQRYNGDEKAYCFSGWTPEIAPVTGPAIYTATFEEVKTCKLGVDTRVTKEGYRRGCEIVSADSKAEPEAIYLNSEYWYKDSFDNYRTIKGTCTGFLDSAFRNLPKLKAIHFSSTINTFHQTPGQSPFYGDTSLRYITVDFYNEHFTSRDGVLYSKDMTTLLAYPQARGGHFVIPEGVTTIGSNAFEFASCTSVTFPSTLKTMAKDAFIDCYSLTTITIPKELSFIPTISHCPNLERIEISPESEYFRLNEKGLITSLDGATLIQVTPNPKDEVLVIDESITSISPKAFNNCYNLLSLTLPSSFAGQKDKNTLMLSCCTRLEDLTIPACEEPLKDLFSAPIQTLTIKAGVGYIPYEFASSYTSLKTVSLSKDIKSIGEQAFYGVTNLKTVYLEEGSALANIGDRAFAGCTALEHFDAAPNLKQIDRKAFDSCVSLSSFSLGSLVKTIDGEAFNGCTSLSSFLLDATNSSFTYSEQALYSKDGKQLVKVMPGISGSFHVKEGTEKIAYTAFLDCAKITSLTIPTSVTEFKAGTLSSCAGLRLLSLPFSTSLTDLFKSSKVPALDTLIIAGGTTLQDGMLTPVPKLKTLILPESIASVPFAYLENLTSLEKLTLPNGNLDASSLFRNKNKVLETLTIRGGTYCANFSRLPSLRSITLSPQTTRLVSGAFEMDSGLTSVTIPASLEAIPYRAFSNCTALQTVQIESGSVLTTIGGEAFYQCQSLNSINLPASIKQIVPGAFTGCPASLQLSIPGNDPAIEIVDSILVEQATKTAIGATRKDITEAVIPEGVTKIKAEAFKGYANLTSVSFPSTLKTIANAAFEGCLNLNSVTFGEDSQLTKIEYSAFKSCHALSEFTLPKNLTEVTTSTFEDCPNINHFVLQAGNTALHLFDNALYQGSTIISYPAANSASSCTIENGTDRVDSGVFNSCSHLASVTFPDSLQYLGGFTNCDALESVVIPAGIKSIYVSSFTYCDRLTSVRLSGANASYSSVDGILYNQTSLTVYPAGKTGDHYALPDGTNSILTNAFGGNRFLKTLSLPSTLTSLGNDVFSDMSSLEYLVIPATVTSFGNYCFENCQTPVFFETTTIPSTLYSPGIPKIYYLGGSWAYDENGIPQPLQA